MAILRLRSGQETAVLHLYTSRRVPAPPRNFGGSGRPLQMRRACRADAFDPAPFVPHGKPFVPQGKQSRQGKRPPFDSAHDLRRRSIEAPRHVPG